MLKFIDKIKNWFTGLFIKDQIRRITLTGKEFAISDTHFSDQKVLKNQNRSYANWKQMNEQMTHIWNDAVSHDDTVIFCGDFARMTYLQDKVGIPNAINQIYKLFWNQMFFVKGNHDLEEFYEKIKKNVAKKIMWSKILYGEYEGIQCVFIHNPKDVMHINFQRPTIIFHGHLHGKSSTAVDRIRKNQLVATVDVSWDVLKAPVSLEVLINKHKKRSWNVATK